MILNNYWNWLNTIQKYGIYQSANPIDAGLTNRSGNSQLMLAGYPSLGDHQVGRGVGNNRNFNRCGIIVGSGDTTITPTTYDMENEVTNSLSSWSTTITYSGINNCQKLFTATATNSSGSDLTITEVGIQMSICGVDGETYNNVLFAISKLDDPIVVPSGAQIRILFEMEETSI